MLGSVRFITKRFITEGFIISFSSTDSKTFRQFKLSSILTHIARFLLGFVQRGTIYGLLMTFCEIVLASRQFLKSLCVLSVDKPCINIAMKYVTTVICCNKQVTIDSRSLCYELKDDTCVSATPGINNDKSQNNI